MSIDHIILASGALYTQVTSELSEQSSKRYKIGGESQVDLIGIDKWKNTTLPNILKKRYEDKKTPWINRDELILLMDWKLAKGKFRPTLPKLIRSNDEDVVERVSRNAFEQLVAFFQSNTPPKWDTEYRKSYLAMLKKTLKVICELKGVGPATGSLILSLLHEISPELAPPFFSDEAFLYYVVETRRPGTPIKYNVKEYCDEYVPTLIDIVQSNPKVNFDQIERGAWALKSYGLHQLDSLINVKPGDDFKAEDFDKFEQAINVKNEDKEKNEKDFKKETKAKDVKKETKAKDIKKETKLKDGNTEDMKNNSKEIDIKTKGKRRNSASKELQTKKPRSN